MSTVKISEAGTVQFPMVKHAVEIGWDPITPEHALTLRLHDIEREFARTRLLTLTAVAAGPEHRRALSSLPLLR